MPATAPWDTLNYSQLPPTRPALRADSTETELTSLEEYVIMEAAYFSRDQQGFIIMQDNILQVTNYVGGCVQVNLCTYKVLRCVLLQTCMTPIIMA